MQSFSDEKLVERDDDCQLTWREFYRANGDSLFQTALLLSADPDMAEAALTSDIDSINASEPPGKDEFLTLQTSVVRHSVRSLGTKISAKRVRARSMLQVGLRPVLQLGNAPRVCLVLRLLLGYTISSCA